MLTDGKTNCFIFAWELKYEAVDIGGQEILCHQRQGLVFLWLEEASDKVGVDLVDCVPFDVRGEFSESRVDLREFGKLGY